MAEDETVLKTAVNINSQAVDVNKAGEYVVTYTVSDESGNEVSVNRKVIVE
jgi:predicted secreted Zn-dependent protease